MEGEEPAAADTSPFIAQNLARLEDMRLLVQLELGRTSKTLNDILRLNVQSVFELDKKADDPVDVFINGSFIGRGKPVGVDGKFGVLITELVRSPQGPENEENQNHNEEESASGEESSPEDRPGSLPERSDQTATDSPGGVAI